MHEYVTTMVVLTGILICVVLAVFLLKKIVPARFTGNRYIKIIDQLSLGSKDRVVLLKIKQDMILVGISSQGMSALHVYKDNAVEQAQDGIINRPSI